MKGKRTIKAPTANGKRCQRCNAPLWGQRRLWCSPECGRLAKAEAQGLPWTQYRECSASDCSTPLTARQRKWCSKRCERRERYRTDPEWRAKQIARTCSTGRRARREARNG